MFKNRYSVSTPSSLRNILLLTCTFLFLTGSSAFALPPAQLTGTKTVGVGMNYATIADAVSALNTLGVGTGGVIFNVSAGHTENSTSQITITAAGTAANPITFQKSGTGANPIITRTDAGTYATSTIGGLGDGILRINGTDYITFNGIDLAATAQGIEYGYFTHKPSGTNGCQNVAIKNAVITMTKGTSAFVVGIYISNGPTSVGFSSGVTVSASSGINSDITITGNTIQNVHYGIINFGSSAAGFKDNNIIIGQSGAGNTIQNFGGESATNTTAVYFRYVNNPQAAYNTITNEASPHIADMNGIFYTSCSGDVVGSNNAFNLSSTGSILCIYPNGLADSYTFNNNTFASSTNTATGYKLINIVSSTTTPNITVSGNSTVGTLTIASGVVYGYYNNGTATSGTETITNNDFSNIVVNSGNSEIRGIYSARTGGQNRVCSNNTVSNISSSSTETLYGIYTTGGNNNQIDNNNVNDLLSNVSSVLGIIFYGTNAYFYNNNVYNLTTTSSSLTGVQNSVTGTTYFYNNKIYNLTNNKSSGATCTGVQISAGTSQYIYNNFISDIKLPIAGGSIKGFWISDGTSVALYFNTVYLTGTSASGNFSIYAIYYSATSNTVDMRNNIFVNDATPIGTGKAIAFYFNYTTAIATYYSSTSDYNLFYAGSPNASHLIFYDGSQSDQTLSAFKTRVAPRDANSITKAVNFVSATDLHLAGASIGDGDLIATPLGAPYDTDIDGEARSATYPYMGADENTTSALPVELTSFSASVNGGSVVLNWQTATEVNNYGFQVERIRNEELGIRCHVRH